MNTVADLMWAALWGPEIGFGLRVWLAGHRRRYPVLILFQFVNAIHSVASYWVIEIWGWNSIAYLWLWSASKPILWVLMLGVLFEISRRYRPALPAVCLILSALAVAAYLGSNSEPGAFLIEAEPFVYTLLLAGVLTVWFSDERLENDSIVLTIFGVRFAFLSLLQFQDLIAPNLVSTARYLVLPVLFTALPIYGALMLRTPDSTSGLGTRLLPIRGLSRLGLAVQALAQRASAMH